MMRKPAVQLSFRNNITSKNTTEMECSLVGFRLQKLILHLTAWSTVGVPRKWSYAS